MKSGTNWLCKLLNLHPEIHGSGEYHWQHYFATYQKNRQKFVTVDRQESKDAVIRRRLEDMVRKSLFEKAPPSARWIGDRTPHTLHPVVVRYAPHFSIIRDLRDVMVSRMYHFFNSPNITSYFSNHPEMEELRLKFVEDPWLFHKNPELLLSEETFVRGTAKQWKSYLVADRRTMMKQPRLPVMLVHYEKLHQSVEPVLKSMYEFLGADPELAHPIPPALMPGHSKETPNQFNRKGQVGDWKNYMTEQAKQWINEEAGEELLNQEYATSLDWPIQTIKPLV